jgi:hypothetical protein
VKKVVAGPNPTYDSRLPLDGVSRVAPRLADFTQDFFSQGDWSVQTKALFVLRAGDLQHVLLLCALHNVSLSSMGQQCCKSQT